jgi:hypothetical protein
MSQDDPVGKAVDAERVAAIARAELVRKSVIALASAGVIGLLWSMPRAKSPPPSVLPITAGVPGELTKDPAQDRNPVLEEPATPETEPPLAESNAIAKRVTRRVPPHFTKVGISRHQREQIYDIRAGFGQRIATQKEVLAKLEAEELAACEEVLNEPQRRRLQELRRLSKAPKPREP